ncbi:hypothetical protein [Streptomyces coerulescens]|uniref:LemA family protein n=1 Tax=Streptomyces coerulescens TaxID=29304 RepID=A0ABW0CXQ0_STRCD
MALTAVAPTTARTAGGLLGGDTMSLAVQLPALIGVVIGGLVSFAGSAMSERFRWKREVQREWSQRRFEAYRELIHVAHVQVGAARSLATTKNLLEGPPPVSIEDGVKEIADSDRRLALAYETVQMLGDERVGQAAHAFRSTIWKLSDYARGVIEVDATEWERAYKRYRISRDKFHAAIRSDLGITGKGYQRNVSRPSTRPPHIGPR